ncbi:MAG: formate dehydrogenase subunit alpha [Euryarchaeota archaeon]|nr:formate dehydrogenase subunit alpha [Euryarchaeota archaeon]
MEKILTTCPYCGCGCGMFLHVEDGQVVGSSPSTSHPLSRGRLCVKGWLAHDFIHHPDRLRSPLIRDDDRQIKATWEDALSLVSRRMKEITETFGPDSIAVLTSAKGTNEENYLLMKLARAVLKTNNVDHVARLCHAPSVTGLSAALGSGAMTNPLRSLISADVVLVTGSNTTEQHPLAASCIMEAKSRGAKLIVVDPRTTGIARLADLHLVSEVGSDVAWTNGMVKVIIDEGLLDQEFIERRTEGFGLMEEAVSGYTPELVEKISGIPAVDLRRAAVAFGSAERGSIVYAMGTTQHANGTENVLALANLALVTGNLGREGTGIYPLRGHQNVQGACDMGALPDLYPGYQSVSDAGVREKFERAWGVSLSHRPGLTAMEIMGAAEEGRVRGIYISGENPMLSYPDQDRVRKSLESLEFLAVADIFPTETTALADVVLPVASFAEKDGTFTSTERRVQRVRKAIDPVGGSRSEGEVAVELMNRLGLESGYSRPEEVMEEIARLAPIYGGIGYPRLGAGGIFWPCPDSGHPATEILHQDSFSIGRARFHPTAHQDLERDEEYPFVLITGRYLFHFHTGTMTRRTPLLDREIPRPKIEINPRDAEKMGIGRGWMVVVESKDHRLTVEAEIIPDVPPKTVFMPFHFREAPANLLTTQRLDPRSKIPALKRTLVRITGV